MVFVALGMPFAFLGVLFTMDRVESWVVREAPARPEVTSFLSEQRRGSGTNDPGIMVTQGPLQQSV